MNPNKVFFYLILLSTIFIAFLGNSSCAVIVPPTGGPKDTLPPRLVLANPHNSSLHVSGNKIVLYFDEYVDVKDVSANIAVSPIPKVNPLVESKLKAVTVKIKDTLQPNTTYSINFGKAIRDVNEGNILRNFTYVFSTGSYIDSMEYSGRVLVANTGKADSTLIAILHLKKDDSAVVKERPRYFTRVDSTGHFTFRYIAPGTYYLYAMKDDANSRKYLSKSQLFAFADSAVVIGKKNVSLTLYAYAEKDDKTSGKTSGSKSGTGSKPAAEKPKDKEKDKRLQFSTTIKNGQFDVLDTLTFVFANALKIFDSSQLRFTDENYKDIRNYHFIHDSTNKKITLVYNWMDVLDTKFYLIATKEFAQDSAGRKLLKTDTIPFSTKKESDYGEVDLRFRNLDLSRNPVLQFVQSDVVKRSYVFKRSSEFKIRLFEPGEYELRILYDDNKNGVWDPGEFFGKHRQPEKVQPIRNKLNVKANWDNDKDIPLP